jgi:hypothetical protein
VDFAVAWNRDDLTILLDDLTLMLGRAQKAAPPRSSADAGTRFGGNTVEALPGWRRCLAVQDPRRIRILIPDKNHAASNIKRRMLRRGCWVSKPSCHQPLEHSSFLARDFGSSWIGPGVGKTSEISCPTMRCPLLYSSLLSSECSFRWISRVLPQVRFLDLNSLL